MTAQADFEGYVFRYGAVPPVIIDKTLASADVSTLPPGRWAQLRDGKAYRVRSAIALSNGRPSPPLSDASLYNAAYRGQAADIAGMAPYTAGLRSQRCGICMARYWEGESTSMCCDGGKVNVPVLPYRIPEPLDGWVNGSDAPSTNYYRANSSRINNSLAPACMKAKWIFKAGSNMPSTVNVQGQVQASIPHVPRLNDPHAAAFMIQSAFYDQSDARARHRWH